MGDEPDGGIGLGKLFQNRKPFNGTPAFAAILPGYGQAKKTELAVSQFFNQFIRYPFFFLQGAAKGIEYIFKPSPGPLPSISECFQVS